MLMSGEGKRQFNVRVDGRTVLLAEKASFVRGRTKAQVVEEAIADYATKHGISERYQLNIKNGMMVLLKLDGESAEILEMETLNGVPPEVIAQRYASRFHQAVPLVVDK